MTTGGESPHPTDAPPPCPSCGIDPAGIPAPDAVVALRSYPRRWRAVFAAIDDEDDARALVTRRPAPGTWSALEYAAHTRDVFDLYDERVRRVLTLDHPALPGVDPDGWAAERRYGDEPLDAVLGGLDDAARRLADRLERVAGDDWRRTGVREGEEISVLWMARQAVHEGAHHLRDAERSLRAASAAR